MRRLACVLMLALMAACRSGGATAGGTGEARPTARRVANVVLADEIAEHGGANLHDILRALRPAWFNTAPTRMTGGAVYVDAIAVYVDGRRIGTPPALSEIPVGGVVQVRYYRASEAQGRFGLGNLQGAIDVITTR